MHFLISGVNFLLFWKAMVLLRVSRNNLRIASKKEVLFEVFENIFVGLRRA